MNFDLCESPLERRLGEAMLDVFQEMRIELQDCELPGMLAHLPGWDSYWYCQLDMGWCRPDFTLVSRVPFDAADIGYAKDPAEYDHTLIIEVDGHDFHERTKEQARRDRGRDRRMLAQSMVPLRFTGQEVHQDAQACASQAIQLYVDRQQKIMARAFDEYLRWVAADPERLAEAQRAGKL